MQLTIISIIAAVFAVLWAVTFYFYYTLKKQPKTMTVEAQQLLGDLFASGAILRIEVLDPKNLLYHRG
jgi:RsiW-degrading membrane proteinase PrsW (M82 family)